MNDEQLLRYNRQIMLPAFGFEAQQKLLDSRVLIVGAGGLGSPAALYLAAAGVGTIAIADDDEVELSNLQRQILHTTADIGRAKVDSARDRLQGINPDVRVLPIPERLHGATLRDQVREAAAVIDGSDNFATRFAVNAACVAERTPLISGAAIRTEGQLSVYDVRKEDSPCYRCLYREQGEVEETCADNGVLAPIVGIIGSLQALEAVKILTGVGMPLVGRLLIFDGHTLDFRTMKLRKDPACPVCAK